jgi:ATP/maltotriose-dependent transcriptional regulator MalT
LHRRAAKWYESQGLPAEAITHVLAGSDFDEAARLIEATAQEALWRRGEVATVLGWLANLPEPVIRSRPGLCLVHAWAMCLSVQLDAVEARVEDAKQALKQMSVPEKQRQGILDQIAVMQAMLANFRGDVASTIALSRHALEVVPSREVPGSSPGAGRAGRFCADLCRRRSANSPAPAPGGLRGCGVGVRCPAAGALATTTEQARGMAPSCSSYAWSLVEPLSLRELEVLRLIAAGLSNEQIAAELVVTMATAKKHVSNILGKLNVNSRTQAVARARELRLL